MKRLLISFLITPVLAFASHQQAEEIFDVTEMGDVQLSPEGSQVAFWVRETIMDETRSQFRTQIWLADVDGSHERQLTQGEEAANMPRWSPDGQQLAFLSKAEKHRALFLIPIAGGERVQLTDFESDIVGFKWAPDGQRLAVVVAEPRDEEQKAKAKALDDAFVVDARPLRCHLWLVDLAGQKRRLTEGNFNVGGANPWGSSDGFDWAPNGREIAFLQTPTSNFNDFDRGEIAVVDLETGSLRLLVEGMVGVGSPRYSPDGDFVAFAASDEELRWAFASRLYVIPSIGGDPVPLALTPNEGLQVTGSPIGWSKDGSEIYTAEKYGTRVALFAIPASGEPARELIFGTWVLGGFALNQDKEVIASVARNLTSPPEAALICLDQPKLQRITHLNTQLESTWERTEVVRWGSRDGLEVEGLLTYPKGYQAGHSYPLIVMVHGGPTGVWGQDFRSSSRPDVYPVPLFSEHGYAVLQPNPRGSDGYGREFRFSNRSDFGGGDFEDIMSGVDSLIAKGIADPERLGIMGWSYGGYMSAWAITQTNRFKAASVGAAVTDLPSMTGTCDIPDWVPDYFEGELWETKERLIARSPVFQIGSVTTPTLILHGAEDKRVPLGQGYEFYIGLKRQGVPVEMVVYPRTPHSPSEPKHCIDIARRNLDWFDRHMG